MTTLLTLIIICLVAITIVKILGCAFDSTYSSTSVGSEVRRLKFNDDESSIDSSSIFDDDYCKTSSTSLFEDDSPARGLWDITSIYYDTFHHDDSCFSTSCSIDDHYCSSSDDSWSSSSSTSSFDD